MILVDSPVWIDHLHKSNSTLSRLLQSEDIVYCHDLVIGELAVGNIKNRGKILQMMQKLLKVPRVTESRALDFIDKYRLMGSGLSYVDAHLLASCQEFGFLLWTNDKKLAEIAKKFNISYKNNR